MARLIFDDTPLIRSPDPQHDAWVQAMIDKWRPGEAARPCDCGFWGDQNLVTCSDADRVRCRRDVTKRLHASKLRAHKDALKEKRRFPAPNAARGKGTGWCSWCGQEIIDPKTGQRSKRRSWHPDCLTTYFRHTRMEDQKAHLLDRDGLGCAGCGEIKGKWSPIWTENREGKPPATIIQWWSPLEVDHRIALGVVWEAGLEPAQARWFFGPGNLNLLCRDCHAAKTGADVALIKRARVMGPRWTALTIRALSNRGAEHPVAQPAVIVVRPGDPAPDRR